MDVKTHYEVLGVEPAATEQQIQEAYRVLISMLTPTSSRKAPSSGVKRSRWRLNSTSPTPLSKTRTSAGPTTAGCNSTLGLVLRRLPLPLRLLLLHILLMFHIPTDVPHPDPASSDGQTAGGETHRVYPPFWRQPLTWKGPANQWFIEANDAGIRLRYDLPNFVRAQESEGSVIRRCNGPDNFVSWSQITSCSVESREHGNIVVDLVIFRSLRGEELMLFPRGAFGGFVKEEDLRRLMLFAEPRLRQHNAALNNWPRSWYHDAALWQTERAAQGLSTDEGGWVACLGPYLRIGVPCLLVILAVAAGDLGNPSLMDIWKKWFHDIFGWLMTIVTIVIAVRHLFRAVRHLFRRLFSRLTKRLRLVPTKPEGSEGS